MSGAPPSGSPHPSGAGETGKRDGRIPDGIRARPAIYRLIKNRGEAEALCLARDPTEGPASYASRWRQRFAGAYYSAHRAALCGRSHVATVTECGHHSDAPMRCGLARMCPDCADREAKRQFAVTLDRWECWLEPGDRPWLVTMTTPWTPAHELDARRQLTALRRAWLAWVNWLSAARGDVRHWDAWAQLGHGQRWHVHAIVWTSGADCGARWWPMSSSLVRFTGSPRSLRPWLVPAEVGREAWRDATGTAGARVGLPPGWVWRADACRERKGGPLMVYGGERGDGAAHRAAAYSARYAGRPWAADTPPEVVALLAVGLRYLHSTWRDRQPARPARPASKCPGCGRPLTWDAADPAACSCFAQAVRTSPCFLADARFVSGMLSDNLGAFATSA